MKLELKNITHNERLSEETPAYAGTVYVDGKPMLDVSNNGQGGSDMVHGNKAWKEWTYPAVRDLVEKIDAYLAENHPPVEIGYGHEPMTCDFELWCGEQLERHLTMKVIHRYLKKWAFIRPGDAGVSYLKGKGTEAQAVAQITGRYPGAVLLFKMTPDAVYDQYRHMF